MLDYTEIIETSKAFKYVERDISNDKVSHAYLFVSTDKNYLVKFCESISKLLINNHAPKEFVERNSHRIDSHNHPDVLIYGLDSSISVDVVSLIVEQSNYKPFESDKKIFVISNFEDVSEICQNKILKTIEEPPENTYFLICTSSLSRILPTIISRVKKIDLDRPSENQIKNLLIKYGASEADAEIYATCSSGDISLAEKLIADGKFIDFFNQVVKCLFEINGSRDVIGWANTFSSKQVDKDEFLDIMNLVLRDIMMIKSGAETLVNNVNIKSKLKLISASLDNRSITVLMKEISKLKESLQFNVNQTSIIDDFLFKIAEVKVKCRRLSV